MLPISCTKNIKQGISICCPWLYQAALARTFPDRANCSRLGFHAQAKAEKAAVPPQDQAQSAPATIEFVHLAGGFLLQES